MKIFANHNCKLTRRLLHERLDGDLGPAEVRWLEACLADCPACAEYAARLTEAVSLLRAAGPVPTPEYLPRRIRSAATRTAAVALARAARRCVPALAWPPPARSSCWS
jgi:anti-sigma factor RsiW